jgi:hypothetical protein
MAITKNNPKEGTEIYTVATSTAPFTVSANTTSSNGGDVTIIGHSIQKSVPNNVAAKAIENHLKFLRSVGRTSVPAEEVARALSLPLGQVERVASTIPGVKINP